VYLYVTCLTVHGASKAAVGATSSHEQTLGKLGLELRRGVVVLAVLSQLKTEQYGYSLRQSLASQGLAVEEGTLYPLLRRMESQGLLRSEWRIEREKPRRYYMLSVDGARLFGALTANWHGLVATMDRMLSEDGGTAI
jgi:DNA-binding PadR family transcriptional regulator